MKFARIGSFGEETPVAITGPDRFVDISGVTRDIDGHFLSSFVTAELEAHVANRIARGFEQRIAGNRLGAPIARPHQIICIGLNYADHAAESGMTVPDEPIVFNKAPNTLVGPNDDILMPRASRKADWEVELGVVIGKSCRYLGDPRDAADAIAGYAVVNDVSEREFQLERGGQWVKGKSCETFNPCGPWLVTPDEIPDVQDLNMLLNVNGERMQTGSTRTMIFGVHYLIWYLSQFMVLEPGDLINTGTPPGVGMGKKPERYLSAGDVIDLEIEFLGTQKQTVKAPA